MTQITLVGASLAEPGREFYYLGPISECSDCRLKNVCFNLDPGSRYRVVEIREQKHDCREFLGDAVVAAVVDKVPTPAAVAKKSAMEGSIVTFQHPACKNMGCNNYRLCHPVGKSDGDKSSVSSVKGDLACPIGLDMVQVDLLRAIQATYHRDQYLPCPYV